jgi:hypothetical protein
MFSLHLKKDQPFTATHILLAAVTWQHSINFQSVTTFAICHRQNTRPGLLALIALYACDRAKRLIVSIGFAVRLRISTGLPLNPSSALSVQPQTGACLGSSLPSSRPSRLKGMEQEWPPGVYEITTTEEALGDFMYEAFRRISTTIYLPPRSGDYGIGKVVDTDPAEMENITNHPSVS